MTNVLSLIIFACHKHQINSCSNGTATTTVTFVGSASGNTQYYDLQRRENGGSWVTTLNGQQITAGETNTHTSSAFNDGTLVEWQYRIGDSNPSSGSYTTTGTGSGSLDSSTSSCFGSVFDCASS